VSESTMHPPLQLEAERYQFSEALQVYVRHPEGLPPIDQNRVVIGYPGIGKTLALKVLWQTYSSDPSIVPVYALVEPWVASISRETSFPGQLRLLPKHSRITICARALLALCLIDETCKRAGFDVARAGLLFAFSEAPIDARQFKDWT
jgi:hypothetical protein